MARLPPVQEPMVHLPPVQVLTVNLPPVLALMVKLALAPPVLMVKLALAPPALMVKLALAPPAPIPMAQPPLELIPKQPTLPPETTRTPLATLVQLIIMPQHPRVLMVKMPDTVNTLTPALNLQTTSWPPRLNK
jgi:hypothetical protein